MSVSNGQDANQDTFNNAFVSKTTDSTMTGKLALNRVGSGTQVTDVQQAINDNITDIAQNATDIADHETRITQNEGDILTLQSTIVGVLKYQGTWNASTNSPTLADGTGTNGYMYVVSTSGSQDLGAGSISFSTGDFVIHNGSVWQKVDAANPNTVGTDSGTGDLTPTYKLIVMDSASRNNLTGIGVGFDGQDLVIINRTGDVITIVNDEISTDGITTGTGADVEMADNASFYLVYDGTEQTWNIVGGTGSGDGASASGIILGTDSNFESTIGNWIAYADAAQATPEDGTGGTANCTLDVTTSAGEVLNGEKSLKYSKDAADRQGEGFSVTKSVPNGFIGQPVELKVKYSATSNFDFGTYLDPSDPSDIMIYPYDVTNSRLIQPNPSFLSGDGLYSGVFQIPSDCASIRIIFHVATTNANAWDFIVDDVELDIASNVSSPAVSDPVSYSPTLVGFGTVTNSSFKYHIEGAFLVIEGYFTTGTRTATEAQLPLPTGYVVSSDSPSPIALVGEAGWGGDTPTSYTLLATPGDTFLNFGSQDGGSAIVPINGSSIFGNSTNVALKAKVRVQGATSGYAHPAQIGLNARVVMRAYKSAGSTNSATKIASWSGVTVDTVGGFNTSTGDYTVKSPGDYGVVAHMGSTTTSDTVVSIYVNGTRVLRGTYGNTTNLADSIASGILPNLKYGDVISVYNDSAGSRTWGGTDDSNILSIHKLGSQSQPYAPRVAYLKDVKAANTAGGTATSGSFQTRTLNTLTGDTSFVSLSSNQFTLQPGTYDIEASAPAGFCGRHITKLRNITDASDTSIGTSEADAAESGGFDQSRSFIQDRISISSAKTFEIQHRVETTRSSDGFGRAANLGVSETYTVVKITKIL